MVLDEANAHVPTRIESLNPFSGAFLCLASPEFRPLGTIDSMSSLSNSSESTMNR